MDIKTLQTRVRNFVNSKNIEASIENRLLDLCSEVGELCKEVLKGNKYGNSGLHLGRDFENEIGDVLFSIICLANTAGIEIEMAIENSLKKYEVRINNTGDAASGK